MGKLIQIPFDEPATLSLLIWSIAYNALLYTCPFYESSFSYLFIYLSGGIGRPCIILSAVQRIPFIGSVLEYSVWFESMFSYIVDEIDRTALNLTPYARI